MIELIADSIRNHFILDPKRADKLMSDDNYEDSSLLSVVIFVGLCHQHAIPKQDVKTYLGMEEDEYKGKITKFLNLSDKALKRVNDGNLLGHTDMVFRFFSKYNMGNRYVSQNATRARGKKLYVWRSMISDG